MSQTIKITQVEELPTTTGKIRWVIADGFTTYSIWNKDLADLLKKYEGKTVSVEVQDLGKFKNIKNFYAEVSPSPSQAKPNTNTQTPDWDKIAEGKVRSLFLQAHIQRNGLVKLTDDELEALVSLVKVAMGQ